MGTCCLVRQKIKTKMSNRYLERLVTVCLCVVNEMDISFRITYKAVDA